MDASRLPMVAVDSSTARIPLPVVQKNVGCVQCMMNDGARHHTIETRTFLLDRYMHVYACVSEWILA